MELETVFRLSSFYKINSSWEEREGMGWSSFLSGKYWSMSF